MKFYRLEVNTFQILIMNRMSSLDILAGTKPKENAGPRAANRFSYQVNWGLKKLIELETNDEDYVMIFDYHDDIVICNSDKQSSFMDFYQIKSKVNDNWTLSLLNKTSAESSDGDEDKIDTEKTTIPKMSILAKLLSHTKVFEHTRGVYFVTTSKLAKSIYKKANDIVEFSKLEDSSQKAIKENIEKEIGKLDDECYKKLFFIQNQMSVNSYQETMIGVLTKFLKEKFNTTATDIGVVYDNIISQLTAKNNYEPEINSKDNLLSHKAISHNDFRNYLNGLTYLKSFDEIVEKIIKELSSCSIPFHEKHQVKRCLHTISTELKDYENDELQRLLALTNSKLELMEPNEHDIDLWAYVNRIFNIVQLEYNNYKEYSELYIKSLILYKYEKNS